MTGTCDVTTCAGIVYMENISELTFHRLASFLLKMISWVTVPGCVLPGAHDPVKWGEGASNSVRRHVVASSAPLP